MTSLGDLTTPAKLADGRYGIEIPTGWRQGRGAYGGLVVATLVRAIEDAVGDRSRAIRSVTAEIPAPVVAGAAEIAVDLLRAGKNVSTLRASLVQDGETRAHAVAVAAESRRSGGETGWQELAPPDAPSWRTLGVVPWSPVFPEFAQHMEFRVVDGIPTSGAAARTVGWVRCRLPGGLRDTAHIAAMIDAWWPAALVRLPAMRPMATIAYTLDVVHGLDGLDPDAPLLYRSTAPVLTGGYCLETRELWGEDGRLVALNHQTFVVIA